MFSPKMTWGAKLFPAHKAAGKSNGRPWGPRRSKTLANLEELTLDPDVWQPQEAQTPKSEGAERSPSPEWPSTPSPPVSIDYGDDEVGDGAPYYAKLARWQRDVTLPGGTPLPVPPQAITLDPCGARLWAEGQKNQVLLAADATAKHNVAGLKDLLMFGLTRHATRLSRDLTTQKLIRTRMGGKRVAVKSGTYAFVIDQDRDLLVSLTASPKTGAPAGAHLNLVAGLPVLFAGELTIEGGAIVSYTLQSGSYRTPMSLVDVAQKHPLLLAAAFEAPAACQPPQGTGTPNG